MANQVLFVGFSTQNAERTRQWAQYDVELIKRDLYNHFHTRIGERVMRPEFGCRIWDMLMEPMTPFLRQDMIDEAIRVCNADPRVTVANVDVFDFQNGIRIELTLNFVGEDVAQTFYIEFEREEALRTALTVE